MCCKRGDAGSFPLQFYILVTLKPMISILNEHVQKLVETIKSASRGVLLFMKFDRLKSLEQ